MANALTACLDKLALADIAFQGAPHTFQLQHEGKVYTARLDRVYAPLDSPLAPQLLPTANPHISDHAPVRIQLKAIQPPRSPVWRLNMATLTPQARSTLWCLVDDLPASPNIREWE